MLAISTTQPLDNIDRIIKASLLSLTLLSFIYGWSMDCVVDFGRLLSTIGRIIITSWVIFLSCIVWLDGGLHW